MLDHSVVGVNSWGGAIAARGGAHRLSPQRLGHRLRDPSGQIKAAWLVKEALRDLLAARDRHTISHRLCAFYDAVLAADLPETTRLVTTNRHRKALRSYKPLMALLLGDLWHSGWAGSGDLWQAAGNHPINREVPGNVLEGTEEQITNP